MVTVAAISYTDIRDQPELLAEYAAECGVTAAGPPNPQWAMYERMQAAGMMQAFGVYVDGAIAGFAVVLVSVLPHYGFKAATVETLFVDKAARKLAAGARLMAGVEEFARAAECKVILYSAPAGGALEAVLGKRYARTNSVFFKSLS